MDSERHNGTPVATNGKHGLPAGIPEEEIRQQLDRIRASQPFRSSRRCIVFLDFVVRAVLEGRFDSLKERTIGIEVFARDPNYDTNQDPVVRGTASEVRKRLAQYYQAAGHERELRIELPAGSYLPDFHPPVAESTPVKSAEPMVPVRSRAQWGWASFTLAGVIAGASVALLTAHAPRRPQTVLDELWAPVLQSSGPVLLCVGQPKVYNLLGSLETEMERLIPGPGHRPAGTAANQKLTFTVGQVVPNWDRYLALGDAECLSNIAALLAQHGRAYHIRGGGSTSFADLRESPSVLIGGFTNDWTLRLTGQMRFSFELGPDPNTHYVHDRLHPENRDWQLGNVWPDWKMPIDYAIVSRVLDPITGKMVVTAAGITQYGTAAAGEFLTNPEYLSELIRQAPHDWQHKNIQAVLATHVIDGTAGPPSVLAYYFW